jgi:hypothetical protein
MDAKPRRLEAVVRILVLAAAWLARPTAAAVAQPYDGSTT